MTTPRRPQEPRTPDRAVVPAADPLAACEIPFSDLTVVTGGGDDDRVTVHEPVHVVQPR
jgi:hypothetical protein